MSYIKDWINNIPQYLLPHFALSAGMHKLAECRNTWVKRRFINIFMGLYNVDLSNAERCEREDYVSFNDFFTRALKPEARPIDSAKHGVVSPIDGAISQIGFLDGKHLIQAKGMEYSAKDLLPSNFNADQFTNGAFATLYLAPRDYHRVHCPITAQLRAVGYTPGRLFAVKPSTVNVVPRLFTRNERVSCIFDTPAGTMGLIFVAAMLVGGIDTVWHGRYTPPHGKAANQQFLQRKIEFQPGDELGRFHMGSTVILLFEKNRVDWLSALQPGSKLRMGQQLGTFTPVLNAPEKKN